MTEKGKIDLVKLDKMLREGKSGNECAEYFGVYPSAITQAKQKLKTHIVRTAAMEKSSQVVEAHLDMAGQMRRINEAINEELDRIQQMLEEAESLGDITKLQEVMVKLASEIRRQLNAQVEIFEAYRDFKEYDRWKQGVIDIMMRYHPKDRNACIKELKEAGLLRGSVQIS
jgi:hypothetical protein